MVGEIIIARIRGIPTEELIRECQQRVIALQADTRCTRVLYDALELERPPIEIVLTQQAFSAELKDSALSVAIVVPNTSIAYLAWLAFGDLNHRVFYNDIAAAKQFFHSEEYRHARSVREGAAVAQFFAIDGVPVS